MSEIRSDNSPIARREKTMNACTEAHQLIREVAGLPVTPVREALQRAVSRLAPFINISVGRVENIYYREARLIRAEEIDALRLAAAEQRRKLEAGRAQVRHIGVLYLQAAERLRALDPHFHCDEISRLEQQARDLGVVDRAGASLAAPVGLGPSPNGEGSE